MLGWETPPPGAAEATPTAGEHRNEPVRPASGLSAGLSSGLSRLNTAVAQSSWAPSEAIYTEGGAAERIYEVVAQPRPRPITSRTDQTRSH